MPKADMNRSDMNRNETGRCESVIRDSSDRTKLHLSALNHHNHSHDIRTLPTHRNGMLLSGTYCPSTPM